VTDRVCNIAYDKKCRTIEETRYENVTEKKCTTKDQTVYETTQEEQCVTVYERQCKRTYGYLQQCQNVPRKQCKQVPKQTPKQVPKQEFSETTKEVPKKV